MPSITHIPCVYRIFCTATGKSYVGSTCDFGKRCGEHRRMLRRGVHHSISLQRAWGKYGENAFIFEILEKVDVTRLIERENAWIKELHCDNPTTSYNIASVAGASMKGRKHTAEARQRMSEQRRGENNSNYRGRMLNCPTCGQAFKAIGNAKKYCSHDCYSKAPKPDSVLRKIGDKARGKKRTPMSLELAFQKRAHWYIITDPTGKEYTVQGLGRFCREHGLDQGSMSHIMRGRQKQHKGWTCKSL